MTNGFSCNSSFLPEELLSSLPMSQWPRWCWVRFSKNKFLKRSCRITFRGASLVKIKVICFYFCFSLHLFSPRNFCQVFWHQSRKTRKKLFKVMKSGLRSGKFPSQSCMTKYIISVHEFVQYFLAIILPILRGSKPWNPRTLWPSFLLFWDAIT